MSATAAQHRRLLTGLGVYLLSPGGEQRLSDFLLWESAPTELVFRAEMWPEFTATGLADCLSIYRRRDRRFGAVTVVPPRADRHHLRVIS